MMRECTGVGADKGMTGMMRECTGVGAAKGMTGMKGSVPVSVQLAVSTSAGSQFHPYIIEHRTSPIAHPTPHTTHELN